MLRVSLVVVGVIQDRLSCKQGRPLKKNDVDSFLSGGSFVDGACGSRFARDCWDCFFLFPVFSAEKN